MGSWDVCYSIEDFTVSKEMLLFYYNRSFRLQHTEIKDILVREKFQWCLPQEVKEMKLALFDFILLKYS
jgi:hypothetical protein